MPHRALQEEERSLWTLFGTFFKIGLFTFGGGYAMIALLENEFITKKHWLGRDEFLDMAAIAESTPGPVAINSATYLGYKLAGVPGAAVATVAVFLAGVRMLKALERTPLNVGILLVVMACMIAFSLLAVKFSSIAFIFLSGMVGVAVWGTGRNQKGGR